MVPQGSLAETAYSRAISKFLPHVICRIPNNPTDRDAIYRLRYAAYSKEGALPPGAPEVFKDPFDESANGASYGFYIEGQLASSIRLHVGSTADSRIPAMAVFSDILQPLFDQGKTIIDPTRFVVEANAARAYPKIAHATVRVGWLACEHFAADLVLATVRTEHQSFYRRLFGHKVICDARPYPMLAKPISLMMLDYRAARDRVMQRYPFLRSTRDEREAIFAGDGSACGAAANVGRDAPRFQA